LQLENDLILELTLFIYGISYELGVIML
jgi:hypothetical protein